MSGFLLDTNIPSELQRTRPEPGVEAWVFAQPKTSLFLSVMTIGELRKGMVLQKDEVRRSKLIRWLEHGVLVQFGGRILPVTIAIAELWGAMVAARQATGTPLAQQTD